MPSCRTQLDTRRASDARDITGMRFMPERRCKRRQVGAAERWRMISFHARVGELDIRKYGHLNTLNTMMVIREPRFDIGVMYSFIFILF